MHHVIAHKLVVPRFFDAHVHFRDGDVMDTVIPFTANYCSHAVVMPNKPAIETADQADSYYWSIRSTVTEYCGATARFNPVMTIKLTHRTTPEMIEVAAKGDVMAAKLYPQGATTASHDGITDVKALAPVFERMQKVGMILCIHGEDPAAFVMHREQEYHSRVQWIIHNFPGLKVVLEHITTAKSVAFVQEQSVNVAATITAHHLVLTLDDVIGDGIKPHHFCYPVAKYPADRYTLLQAALSDSTGKFFLGSDSAPHLKGDKESACGCAGIFSAPVVPAILANLFVKSAEGYGYYGHSQLLVDQAAERMALFTSTYGCRFYGITPSTETITLIDKPNGIDGWIVPSEIGGIVPFKAGEWLQWSQAPSE
jgi:dihydroorotase